MQTKRLIQFSIAIALTFFLMRSLLHNITWGELLETYNRINPLVIVACFFVYCLTHLFRAARYYFLLDKKVRYWDMFTLAAAHNMFASIFPFRTGELSFPLLLRRRKIKVTHSLTGLGVGRIFDFYVVCFFFLIAVGFSYHALPDDLLVYIPYVVGLILGIIIASITAITHAMKVVQFLKASERRPVQWTAEKFEEIVAGFKDVHTPGMILTVFFFTFLTWLVQFLWTYWLLSYIFPYDFWMTVVGTSIPFLSTALPIQGFANVGTLEWFWKRSFQAVGTIGNLATTSAFVFHFINILFAVVAGIIGLVVFLKHKPAQERGSA